LVPLTRPTIQELKDRNAARFASEITDPATGLPLGQILKRGPLRVIANAVAGQSHETLGFVEAIAKNAFPDTADPLYLERYAAQRGVARKPAAPAVGAVAVTGTVGAIVSAGTVLQRTDGKGYTVDATAALTASPQTFLVTAQDAGLDSNLDVGTVLRFASPVGFVASTATVLDDGFGRGLSGGLDLESDARLLARLSQVAKTPPQGGSVADYVKWALEVQGVTRVWVRPAWMGAGSVGVAFVLDDDPVSIIPDVFAVDDVQGHIDDLRPVTADVFVFAPTPLAVDFEVILSPDTAAIRVAVEAALEDLLAREADLGANLLLSHVREAVSTAAGEVDSVVVTPGADVVALPYEIVVPGVFTWS
jgi:uncharacterized phage protein gp47/JayE